MIYVGGWMSEHPCRCYSPVFVLAFDVGASYAADFLEAVGNAEAVGRSNLKVGEELQADTEIPCHVDALVLVGVCDGFFGCQESEAGAGEEIGRNDFAYQGQPDFIFEVDRNLDIVAVAVGRRIYEGFVVGSRRASGVACIDIVVDAMDIHQRYVEANADDWNCEFHLEAACESGAVLVVEYVGIKAHAVYLRTDAGTETELGCCRYCDCHHGYDGQQ